MREITEAILALVRSGGRGALATVVQTSGSTPQQPGARLLLLPDGSTRGTVGGGAIEHAVRAELERARSSGTSRLRSWNLAQDLGMCCGGRMDIFIEAIEPAPRLTIFGAGHVSRATAPLARSVGFDVRVVDEREELNTLERFPECTLELRDPTTVLKAEPLGDHDWALIVTHDHRLDEEILGLCLRQRPRYLGLVGSRRKLIRIVQRLRQKQPSLSFDGLHSPVGLDLGAVGPEEIAISIAAELVAVRRGRVAASAFSLSAGTLNAALQSASSGRLGSAVVGAPGEGESDGDGDDARRDEAWR
jgi:xanthine dehydrogenase accessory factor